MFEADIYGGLSAAGQILHGAHFLLCALAVVIASVPLLTEKGSVEHKFGGMIYVPVAALAFLLACVIAWQEQSLLLFCFNAFCAYLLLSGWRAVHAKDAPALIDWLIPGGLFVLAVFMAAHALTHDEGRFSLYLLFFAANGFYLAWRDFMSLRWRAQWLRHKIFFTDMNFGAKPAADWLNRHIAGMIGSVMANLSVVVLSLLPIELHWLWPASLILIAVGIACKQHVRKRQVRRAMAAVLTPKFGYRPAGPHGDDGKIRRAA